MKEVKNKTIYLAPIVEKSFKERKEHSPYYFSFSCRNLALQIIYWFVGIDRFDILRACKEAVRFRLNVFYKHFCMA